MKPPVRSRTSKAQHQARVGGAALSDEAAQQAPVGDAAAGDVARAEREVRAGTNGVEQAGEVGGVVREVGVHLEHVGAAVVERVAKTGEVGGADAVLLGAVQHLDPFVLGSEAVGDLAGAVGRAVVDDEHAKALGRGLRQNRPGGSNDGLNILGLVVGGKDQPGVLGRGIGRGIGHASAYPRAVDLRAPISISAGIDAAVPRRHTPPTMLDVPPARLRSRAASAIHGPTPSTHHLL